MAEALRRAAEDTGVGAAAVSGADAVHVVGLLSWRYRDPGALVAQRLGASPRPPSLGGMGGNSPQTLVNQAFLELQAGGAAPGIPAGPQPWPHPPAGRTARARPQ